MEELALSKSLKAEGRKKIHVANPEENLLLHNYEARRGVSVSDTDTCSTHVGHGLTVSDTSQRV